MINRIVIPPFLILAYRGDICHDEFVTADRLLQQDIL